MECYRISVIFTAMTEMGRAKRGDKGTFIKFITPNQGARAIALIELSDGFVEMVDLNHFLFEKSGNEDKLSDAEMVKLLKGRIEKLKEELLEIAKIANVKGRWLGGPFQDSCVNAEGYDEHDKDHPPAPEENAAWTEYDLDEQNAAMNGIRERALEAVQNITKNLEA